MAGKEVPTKSINNLMNSPVQHCIVQNTLENQWTFSAQWLIYALVITQIQRGPLMTYDQSFSLTCTLNY